jgi:hypothetical protein
VSIDIFSTVLRVKKIREEIPVLRKEYFDQLPSKKQAMIFFHSFASLKKYVDKYWFYENYFEKLQIPPVAWTGRGACGGAL